MVEQSCLTCKKEKECPKAEHFENYYIPGCSEYENKNNINTKENDYDTQ